MFRKFLRKRRIDKTNFFVEPDEIFLDSANRQGFDQQQFEGRIERPIPKSTIVVLGVFFFVCAGIFSVRAGYLQIYKGEEYLKRSESNILEKKIIFADRGIIYDRNKKEMAWNQKALDSSVGEVEEVADFNLRSYLSPGFSHLLGYVSYPAKDKMGNYWQKEFIGKDGLEKQYSDKIKGLDGTRIVEVDSVGNIHSENVTNLPKRGEDLVTTIDSRIQMELFKLIEDTSSKNSFVGGAAMIMDVTNGEIISLVSYPEYDSEIMSIGKDSAKIKEYLNDSRKVFLNRPITGLYTPGSIVKPIFAIAALNERIISPEKEILSTGSISIPNPYFPGQSTIFRDWKAHGWVDMRKAIAVSSDVYFYVIGGGFEGQKGLGINLLKKYAELFGIAQKTGVDLSIEGEGVVPSPEWKAKAFKNDPWRIGNTYHTAIGQYGFQTTVVQMARAIGAIANHGTLVTPHLILGDTEKEKQVVRLDIAKEYFDVAREGMRQTAISGTAGSLNLPFVEVAVKTGTAQVGAGGKRVNSWSVGFFPYDNPKYVFVALMENGPISNTVGASSIIRNLLEWMNINTPEYFNENVAGL